MADFDASNPLPFLVEQAFYLGGVLLVFFVAAHLLGLVLAANGPGGTLGSLLGVLPEVVRYTGLAVAGIYAVARGTQ
ncbi:hypothetical protein [Halarchaeum sp. P4]|uniref:hypothetical protein n=1 Tax=Halarchaeum sp. P4 TaxID=3421639 RepID=UPI003EC12C56